MTSRLVLHSALSLLHSVYCIFRQMFAIYSRNKFINLFIFDSKSTIHLFIHHLT
ncbi:UNVERIFIED_ORG: hypothetical protein J2806_000574 [Kosakonia oryzae]|uniref:Uncharacterized protein n=1 Tax=Kosakonia radicincitans TaxID=283686 RepID=A0AAX2ELV1_9ENTR|nr:hypothetical protein [Kosakonia oryzae]SFD93129.1 hypothetical protein SAMN03159468_00432 [Kosakonia radicincitans]SFQ97752.1 hypothetical protein SAMN03159514_00431 [Kosakonia radicincitans]SFT40935.1 hypothetical protein SAMN03159428_00430 [Kosakonia radicincitans]SKC23301.1 hypothetical protein SAMN05216168_5249 [Kosakonia radicincitans]